MLRLGLILGICFLATMPCFAAKGKVVDSRYETLQLTRFDKLHEKLKFDTTYEHSVSVLYQSPDGKTEIKRVQGSVFCSLSAMLKVTALSKRGYATGLRVEVLSALGRSGEKATPPQVVIPAGTIVLASLKDSEIVLTDESGNALGDVETQFLENFISLDRGRNHQDMFGPPKGFNPNFSWRPDSAVCQRVLSEMTHSLPKGFRGESRVLKTEEFENIRYARVASRLEAEGFTLRNHENVTPRQSKLSMFCGVRVPCYGEPNAVWTSFGRVNLNLVLDTVGEDDEPVLATEKIEIKQQSVIMPQ